MSHLSVEGSVVIVGKLMNFFNVRRLLGIGKSLDCDGNSEPELIDSVDHSRTLRQSGSGGDSRSSSGGNGLVDSSGGATMAGKSSHSEVGYQLLWAYLAGLVTGLALFGAGSFYYTKLMG